MNGPNPVCTLATKKTNQSSPRRLVLDGGGGGSPAGRVSTGAPASVTARPASPSSAAAASHRCGATDSSLLLCLRLILCLRLRRRLGRRGRRFAGWSQHHHRAAFLELRRALDLIARQLDRDDIALGVVVREPQHAPIDRDLAAA